MKYKNIYQVGISTVTVYTCFNYISFLSHLQQNNTRKLNQLQSISTKKTNGNTNNREYY